jgi:hypothetical protein
MKYLTLTLAALLVVACGVAWWFHHEQADTSAQLVTAQAAAIASDFEASAARADVTRVTVYVDRVRVIHDATMTLQQEIPRYVTPDTDRAYPLPVGFVRVHDAAAAGVPLLPSAGDSDAAASGVAASTALGVIAGNYGACHEAAAQLTALQDWVKAHQSPAP